MVNKGLCVFMYSMGLVLLCSPLPWCKLHFPSKWELLHPLFFPQQVECVCTSNLGNSKDFSSHFSKLSTLSLRKNLRKIVCPLDKGLHFHL